MLILSMILRITGFTQEELANYVGVSRASINSWLTNDNNMSDNSKKIICDKFQIPISFFLIDLNQSLDYYKLVFSTLYQNWQRINNENKTVNSTTNKINDILNQIDSDIRPVRYEKLTEIEILEGLSNGYNPFTGEIFEDSHILNDKNVKSILQKVYKYYTNGNFSLTKEDLNDEQLELFEELRKWRKDKYLSEGYYHAFMVFSDRELINIITSDIKNKEDLMKVKGIGNKKYSKYSDDLYEILKSRKYSSTSYQSKEKKVYNDFDFSYMNFEQINDAPSWSFYDN